MHVFETLHYGRLENEKSSRYGFWVNHFGGI